MIYIFVSEVHYERCVLITCCWLSKHWQGTSNSTGSTTTISPDDPTVLQTACGPGMFRRPQDGKCVECEPGTYWDEASSNTTQCKPCPASKTSLRGGTKCYKPCRAGFALDTVSLECIRISNEFVKLASNAKENFNINTSRVYIVERAAKLSKVIRTAMLDANQSTVIALASATYAEEETQVITTNIMFVNAVLAALSSSGPNRRVLQVQPANDTVIVAPPESRHFVVVNASIVTLGVTFVGASNGSWSGGVVLNGSASVGDFQSTIFTQCRALNEGGAIHLTNGASATLSNGSQFSHNSAVRGGGVYANGQSLLVAGPGTSFTNNTASESSSGSGGGSVYLDDSTLVLGSNVTFVSGGSTNDDIGAANATVRCQDSQLATGIVNCTRCSGAYVIPVACPLCSPTSPSAQCSSCPQGTYGGGEAELACQACPSGYTTLYPPSSTSSADCVSSTQSPTHTPSATPIAMASVQLPTGVNVSQPIPLQNNDVVTIMFSNVTSSGAATVRTVVPGETLGFVPLPSLYTLGDPPVYYDIATTATYSGTLQVCLSSATGTFTATSSPRLLHYEGSSWVDITTAVDVGTHTVCGETSSLSPFALGFPITLGSAMSDPHLVGANGTWLHQGDVCRHEA